MTIKLLIGFLVLALAGNYWQYTNAQQRLAEHETVTADLEALVTLSSLRNTKLKFEHGATDEAYANLQDDYAMLEAEHDVIHSPAYEFLRCAEAVYEVGRPEQSGVSEVIFKRKRWCIGKKDEILVWMRGRDYSDIEIKRYIHRAN